MKVTAVLGGQRVVALGSAQGSDAIAWAVARALFGGRVPELCLLATPAELGRWLEQPGPLVILDALGDGEGPPGSVQQVPLESLAGGFATSSHGPGLVEMLRLRRVLNPGGAPWRLLGIRVPAAGDMDPALVARAAAAIRETLQGGT